jgi:two-component system chemotaxis sensor kinase CheA
LSAGVSPEPLPITTANSAPSEKEKHAEHQTGNAIRVDVGLLDKLMNLVGELVLARNQVLQFTVGEKDTAFQGTTQRLNLITTELQESVMKTRMQPIDSLWNKFPRIVRDVSIACGKKIRIEMEGRDTELDKTILEAIKDPLTHILRNSIDHGVETPEARRTKGKPEEGVLHMRAFHEGGRVNIEISDDGSGIDPERVKRKAIDKGLISADEASRMSEREAIDLIFEPGFSTAEKITNVSGRGVGMDVVKTNVEKIGGTVDVQTRLGEGTTLRIRIPLTLAIIPALVVTSGGERFAIPQVSLLELVRIEGSDAKIEMIHGTPVYRLRGKLLPLIYLNHLLKLETAASIGTASDKLANIVVLRGGERQFGLVVDQINDTEEIVVKPLGKQLKGVNVFAGATIMGDGRVALILDVTGLAQRANVVSKASEEGAHADAGKADSDSADRQMLLLCKLEGGGPMAIPLSLVARLEEFPRSSLEEAGGQAVVQYRGQIMPLVDVAEAIAGQRARRQASGTEPFRTESDSIQVVVYSHDNRNIGLRVEQVLDIVQERVQLQSTAARAGVMGTVIIKEKVTELLDVKALVENVTRLAAA